ncbi:MAG: PEP-CTERM sorting domain-containing protein [Phycisphaerae bacterium]|nr:PEP-CTERM sorting domain-containing protein [Phycisphaerae bacterium]
MSKVCWGLLALAVVARASLAQTGYDASVMALKDNALGSNTYAFDVMDDYYGFGFGSPKTYDDFSNSNAGYQPLDGSADTASGRIRLYAIGDGAMYNSVTGMVYDTYSFSNALNASASGTISSLYMNINYSGSLALYQPGPEADTYLQYAYYDLGVRIGDPWAGTSGPSYKIELQENDHAGSSYTLWDTNGLSNPSASGYHSFSGTLTVPLTNVSWNSPIELTVSATAYGGSFAASSSLNTTSITFQCDEPGVELEVTSAGGVPEPATLSLLALGGIAVIQRRR